MPGTVLLRDGWGGRRGKQTRKGSWAREGLRRVRGGSKAPAPCWQGCSGAEGGWGSKWYPDLRRGLVGKRGGREEGEEEEDMSIAERSQLSN